MEATIRKRILSLNHVIVNEEAGESMLSREGLLDTLCFLYDECNKDTLMRKDQQIADFVQKYRPTVENLQQRRVNAQDFELRTLIGRGYYGDVYLALEKQTRKPHALKKVGKDAAIVEQLRIEREIMATARSEWITALHFAFYDRDFVYLAMEFVPGGDLLSLMSRRRGGFSEDEARFYLAEMAHALHTLHQLGYAHRDVKPENVLVDRDGHLKLADFGNAAALNRDGTVTSRAPVGTPDYIAPEVLHSLSQTRAVRSTHSVTCDFWSMGIIGYELVVERTPFHDKDVNEIYLKIVSHSSESHKLTYPPGVHISFDFQDLIDRLVVAAPKRLAFAEIKRHAFFAGTKWEALRLQRAPIVPKIRTESDTSNFDQLDKSASRSKGKTSLPRCNSFSGQNLPYLGLSFVQPVPGERRSLKSVENLPEEDRFKDPRRLKEAIRVKSDEQVADMLSATYQKWEKAKKASDQAYEEQLYRGRAEVAALTAKLDALERGMEAKAAECARLQRSVETYKDSLKDTQRRVEDERAAADRERALHEQRTEKLRARIESQRAEIAALHADLEGLREAKAEDPAMVSRAEDVLSKVEEIQRLLEEKGAGSSSAASSDVEFRSANESFAETERARRRSSKRRSGDDGNLETLIERLGKVLDSFAGAPRVSPAESALEKQIERLQQQLATAREQAVVERQSARSANLSVWKLEKQIQDLEGERKVATRQLEHAEQKMATLREDVTEAELAARKQRDLVAVKEQTIEELHESMAGLRIDKERERDLRIEAEKETVRLQQEIVDHLARIRALDERVAEAVRDRRSAEIKADAAARERERLQRDMADQQTNLSQATSAVHTSSSRLSQLQRNYDLLKEACTTMDKQISELEAKLAAERDAAGRQQRRADETAARLREKESELSAACGDAIKEKSTRAKAETRVRGLESELESLREEHAALREHFVDLQRQLAVKTNSLHAAQESLDLASIGAAQLHEAKRDFERELHDLKEESTRTLNDLFLTRERLDECQRQLQETRAALDDARAETAHLEGVLAEQKKYHQQQAIKDATTLAQYKKLTDTLQRENEALKGGHKRTLAERVLGLQHETPHKERKPSSS